MAGALLGGAVACAADDSPDTAAPTTTAPTTPPDAATTTTTTTTITTTTGGSTGPVDLCADRTDPVALGRLADPSLDEVSGAALSRAHPGTIWLIEDSGNPPVITAVDETGTTVTSVTLEVDATDWEDLALAPGPDGTPHLFVADIGDNAAARTTVAVLRVPEPDPAAGDQTLAPDRIELVLPSGAADAEALLVDPERGDLVVVTKDPFGVGQVLVAPGAARDDPGGPITMDAAGEVELGLLGAVLAGDASPQAGAIALRTPSTVWLWAWDDDATIGEALSDEEPCRAPSVTDLFGEALALDDAGGYVLAGEGVGSTLWRVGGVG
ncbi:MAG TPA: hypothetical protein VK866_18605 [Acidimicrobiales bacterium]|nr:hypothetical protein [Acidimicrobiales bacterium]